MKAGTTTLWGLLAGHSRVFMCTPKEPQYWSRPAVHARGADWYRALFSAARPEQLCGEASACYSRWPEFDGVPERIAAQLPNTKLIYVVRHPAERTYSHYAHEMEERALRGTGPQISFAEALATIPNLVDASRYDAQIERFLRSFPRESLHVLRLEDLRSQPDATWERVQRFLGVPVEPLARESVRADNRAGDRFARVRARRWVRALRDAPILRHAIAWIPADTRRRFGAALRSDSVARLVMRRAVNEHRATIAPLDLAARSALCERLEPTTRWMEGFLEMPLPEWRR